MVNNINSLVGRVLGGYRLERIVGSGATGAVFLGRGVDNVVRAIKVLVPPNTFNADESAEFRKRFAREEQVMRSLRHDNILFVESFGEDPPTGTLYMIMPYIAGGTLGARLQQGPLPFADAIKYLKQLASAIDYANGRNIIHRDIKPGNILLDTNGHVFLVDFGIVKIFEPNQQLTTTGTILGTPEYMSPEQARGESVTRAADIYSLGMVAYHMIAGKPAFQNTSITGLLVQIIQEPPPLPRTLRGDLPEAAQEVLLRSLAKNPGQRYATAAQFVTALEQALSAAPVPYPSPNAPAAYPRPPVVTPGAPPVATPPYPPPGYPPPARPPAGYPPAGYPGTGYPPVYQPPARQGPRIWVFIVVGVVIAFVLLAAVIGFILLALISSSGGTGATAN